MNKAIIIGRLTRDPEMRTTTSGTNSTTFTVAVSRTYTDANGERGTDFLNCVAWRKQAENIAKYCTKGSQVAVEGRIQTRSYDAQDGTKRYVTEIIADNVTFLGGRGSNVPSEDNFVGGNSTVDTTDISEDPFKDFGEEVALSDDDLPF
jgi:single-strand DNA-binding protein